MGFVMSPDGRDHKWQWNDVWGKQYSVENFTFEREFVTLSQRKNAMDMQGVRIIVQSILQRCMVNLSNRAASMIADAAFNRSGVVPGIIQAVLVTGENATEFKSMLELKTTCDARGQKYFDVTPQLVLEHERQMA